ncbi:hypothetical protein CUMW_037550 [Citrus unshiu]|nr:hypothetical protein CUMW_037550 [Citrus unshiu]
MASFLGTVRPSPSSVSCFAPCRRQISVYTSQISLSTSGFFPFKRILQACLQSSFSTIALFVGFLPMGLDDLRDWTNNVQRHIPIYVAMRDFEVMKKTHYYLVDTSGIIPGAAVSELQFNIIDEEPFTVQDLKITPLPVWHGAGYRSLGFRFGNICYIRPDRSSSTHFGLPRALEEVRKIQPKRTLFIGMMHLMDHEKVNEELLKLMETEGLDVQLSYDGLRVPVML